MKKDQKLWYDGATKLLGGTKGHFGDFRLKHLHMPMPISVNRIIGLARTIQNRKNEIYMI
jgi:hypothetical protein